MTRRGLLLALLVVTIAIPQVLAYIAPNDGVGGWRDLNPLMLGINLVIMASLVALLLEGLRGATRSLVILAVFQLFLGSAGIVLSFTDRNGPFQVAAAGLSSIASAIVLLLLRDDVLARQGSRRSEDRAEVSALT